MEPTSERDDICVNFAKFRFVARISREDSQKHVSSGAS